LKIKLDILEQYSIWSHISNLWRLHHDNDTTTTGRNPGRRIRPDPKFFFEESGVQTIIDQHVHLTPEENYWPRSGFGSHGYRHIMSGIPNVSIMPFAEKSQILNIIFPDIAAKEYFDDRMADTLDAITIMVSETWNAHHPAHDQTFWDSNHSRS